MGGNRRGWDYRVPCLLLPSFLSSYIPFNDEILSNLHNFNFILFENITKSVSCCHYVGKDRQHDGNLSKHMVPSTYGAENTLGTAEWGPMRDHMVAHKFDTHEGIWEN